jgi:hypothetical protein
MSVLAQFLTQVEGQEEFEADFQLGDAVVTPGICRMNFGCAQLYVNYVGSLHALER